ncbi:pro-epidermal growth factor-like [Gigantopelta aegis]|uniref:pro-epidermal growth factor-like n=1 Tax=Gigantopelta aegis TaxID=1735272 RepID=UPI001B8898BB|nr:pro-epidermal growth factor-like [Gigantopelta aegis]
MSVDIGYRSLLWWLISLSIIALTVASWGHSTRISPPKIAVSDTNVELTRIRIIDTTPRKLFDTLTSKYQSHNIPNLYLPGTEGNSSNNEFGDVDYQYRNNSYYVVNTKSKQIEAFERHGDVFQRRVVYRGTSSNVRGIAVNWINGDVYWTDSSYNMIFMTAGKGNTPSRHVAVISNDVDNPSGIALHVNKGLMFWLDTHRLQVASLDGRNRSTLLDNVTAPSSLSISYPGNRLYWIDWTSGSSVIVSCDLQGQRWKVITSFPNRRLFDLDVFEVSKKKEKKKRKKKEFD